MTQAFKLNKLLTKDTHQLYSLENFLILLHKNAIIPWLIIVPKTDVTEVFDLSDDVQKKLNQLIKKSAQFLRKNCASEKMNIAAIGNIVSQLHIHIVGRKVNDACWPNVVWGSDYDFAGYTQEQIEVLKNEFINTL